MSHLITERLARRGVRPQRIAIDGQWHTIIGLPALEGIAFGGSCSITFPPETPGWATTRIGSTRFAAWINSPEGKS